MNNRKSRVKILLVVTIILAFCTACGKRVEESEDKTTLILAILEEDRELSKQVEAFNQTHENIEVCLKKYTEEMLEGDDSLSPIRREIAAGGGPDMIYYGMEYKTSAILGEYTENLFPYFEKDEELQKEDYFQNVLEAFSIDGKLYAVPVSFKLQTFAGRSEVLEGRKCWNIQEMMECYEAKKKDMILYPGETKMDVFGTICSGSMEYYVDWERGECRFEGEEFKKLLLFADSFPLHLEMAEDFSSKRCFEEGKAMLFPLQIAKVWDISRVGKIFGDEEITCVGFPVEEGNGTAVYPSELVFAISANSEHKEEAWEFISSFLTKDYQMNIEESLPIHRGALDEQIKAAMEIEYEENQEGKKVPKAKVYITFEGEEPAAVTHITQEEGEQLVELIESVNLSGAKDNLLYEIVREEAEGYFEGNKGLEDTVAVIQSRAKVYIGERKK